MTLKTKTCREDGSSYSPRITQTTWNIYKPVLETLHHAHMPRPAMLTILENEHDFHPSLAQLNAQMNNKWGFFVHQPKIRTSSLTSASHSVKSTPKPFNELPISLPRDLSSSTIISTASSPYSRQDYFTPPVEEHEDLAFNHDHEGLDLEYDHQLQGSNDETIEAEHSQSDETDVPVELEVIDETSWPASSKTTTTPVGVDQDYCSQACCSKLIEHHKALIATGLLVTLQCYTSASSVLLSVIEEHSSDKSIPSADQVWAKLNHNIINGSMFAPNRQSSIWSTPDWHSVPAALREFIVSSDSTKPTSALALLTLTSQYRRTGTFQYFPPHLKGSIDKAYEENLLLQEIVPWETNTRLLARVGLWCMNQIGADGLCRDLQQLAVNTHTLADYKNRQVNILTRVISSHLLTRWVEQPCSALLQSIVMLRSSFGCIFSLEVMLPETIIALIRMAIDLLDTSKLEIHTFADSRLASHFTSQLHSAFQNLTAQTPEKYCPQFASKILMSRSQANSDTKQDSCKYSDQIVLRLAYKIMGKGYVNKFGFEKSTPTTSLHWMPLAECFRVRQCVSHRITTDSILYTTVATSNATDPATVIDDQNAQPPRRASHPDQLAIPSPMDPPSRSPSIARTLMFRLKSTSSSRMSIDSMKELHSRNQLNLSSGIARFSSSSSRMTVGSQFSFSRVTGMGRVNSTASKFSYEADSMSIEGYSPGTEDKRINLSITENVDSYSEDEIHRKVSEWITRELSQKKRPEFGRRSTEPIFVLDAKVKAGMVVVQECV